MNAYLPYIVVGIATGSVYALAGIGLVLTYKTSGVFNFAHGAIATAAAYFFYSLHVEHGLAWPIVAALTLFVGGPLLGFAFELVGRHLSHVAVAWQIAATVGILLFVEACCSVVFGSTPLRFPHFLPTSGFSLGGVNVTYEQLIIAIIPVVATVGLYLAFRLTRSGIAMRAVVENPTLLSISGTSPTAVRRWAWVIGCAFAVLSGLLLAPSVSLDPATLTLLVVQAFGAAAVGRFSSLPMTWVGGILIGIGGSLLTKVGLSGSILAGLAPSLPFLVLFLVLLLSPRSHLTSRQGAATTTRPAAWQCPGRVQIVFGIAVVGFLIAVPGIVDYRVAQWTLMLTSVLLFMSLGLLVRIAGQVSLCQVSFAAIGAVAFSKAVNEAHIPWLAALLLGGLAAVPVGLLLAVPAIRFSGVFLGLATLGFGLMLRDMFYTSNLMFGFGGEQLNMPKPHLSFLTMDDDKGFYYVVLTITVLVALALVALTRTRLGRMLRGIADSPVAMSASGNSVRVTLMLVFSVAAFVAGISGALEGMVYGQVGALNYDPIVSMEYLAVVLIAVGGEPWYAIISGAGLMLIPTYIDSPNTGNYLQMIFGVAAVAIALRGQPKPLGLATLQRWLDRLGGRRPPRFAYEATTAGPVARERKKLVVDGVQVRFGGLLAVSNVSLTVEPGQVIGLIGPNGAGKTTTLNACSGLVAAASGRISLGSETVTRAGVARRARAGLGRTFQGIDLCDSLTVWDNVAMGVEAGMAGAGVSSQLWSRRGESKWVKAAAGRAIERCQLAPTAYSTVADLSDSERRFVELARCAAGSFDVLLLDEPSSGLDPTATERLGCVVRSIADEDGVGVLLIEHDMSVVMSICDYIYVLDFGEIVFQGTPTEVQSSEIVRAAYLGAEEPTAERFAVGVSARNLGDAQ